MRSQGLILAGLALAGAAIASVPALPAQQLMQQIAGVYKHRFMSAAIVPGQADEPYQAEDVIEIVPYDDEHVYVRVHLDFYNGHTCGIYGMARYEDGGFVHRASDSPPPGEQSCTLRIGVEKGKLTLTDRPRPDASRTCSDYCGARGSLEYEIGMDKRRPIRYLERLKASRQYKEAQDELGRRPSAGLTGAER